MKNMLSRIVLVSAFVGLAIPLSSCTNATTDQDMEAIQNIVIEETHRFFAKDYDGWADTFVPASNAFQIWNNADGSYTYAMGWETISNNVREFIEANPEVDTTPLRFDNFSYRFYGDAAFVTYEKYMGDGDVKPVKEIRVVERDNGAWKIVCVAAFVDYVVPADEEAPSE